jgi:predicted metal-dependent phosphoesterase TrpH
MRLSAFLLFLAALTIAFTQSSVPAAKGRWYKGNLHTHTLNSDGDSTPHEVATWYREHGYEFLVLTDHNHFTDPAGLNALHAAKEKFLLIPGEEVTDSYMKKPIHINALNPERLVQPRQGTSVANTIQNDVDAIREAHALPSLNHPNFHWAITADDLLRVKNLGLFEVYNGHPTVNNNGGGGFQSLDEMWDTLLSAGQRIHGVAVDDAHHFKKLGQDFSNPGRGWVQVRAESLSNVAIMDAISRGDFYASSGVILKDVKISGGELRVEIDARATEKFTTYFVGAGGKILAKSFDTAAAYKLAPGDKYVRARVESSFGSTAWTQPLFR